MRASAGFVVMAATIGLTLAACGSSSLIPTPPGSNSGAGSNGGSNSGNGASAPNQLPPNPLQPAVPGNGQCGGGYRQSDGTLVAQVNTQGNQPGCNTALNLTTGAPAAKGGPYTSDGYYCAAMQQTDQSDGNFPNGSYYAYDCYNGQYQVAFAWGQ